MFLKVANVVFLYQPPSMGPQIVVTIGGCGFMPPVIVNKNKSLIMALIITIDNAARAVSMFIFYS